MSSNQTFLLLLGVPSFLGVLVFWLRNGRIEGDIREAQAHWRTTSGTMLESGVTKERAVKALVYSYVARYRYEVAGISYEGHQVTLFDPQTSWSAPQDELALKF